MVRLVAVAAVLAVASVAVAPAVPSYDPWMWLLWGREVADGALSTTDGPAFKPLPVAVGALLSPLGGGAEVAWVLLVRFAAVLCAWLAFRLGRRLTGTPLGGIAAAAALVACSGWLGHAAEGAEPALVVLAVLAGAELWTAGSPRWALACGVAAALLRVEVWPFLFAAALVHARREPGDRGLLAGAGALVVAAWFVPEWIGSGDSLRSGARARVPNPGQPALADVPAWASLKAGLGVPPAATLVALAAAAVGSLLHRGRAVAAPPTAAGPPAGPPAVAGQPAVAAPRAAASSPPSFPGALRSPQDRALALTGAAGAAWILLVALMAQAGFSGEARYALPGAALLAVAGAAAACRLAARGPRWTPAAAVAAVVITIAPGLAGATADVRDAQRYRDVLASDLSTAIERAGGRDAVLDCGTPYVGRLRGPLLAYRLSVAKRTVEPDDPPRRPGIVFVSAAGPGGTPTPGVDGDFVPIAQAGAWQVFRAC